MARGYEWRTGSRFRKDQDPNDFAAQLRALSPLTPAALVAANKAKGAVMHEWFEWDDKAAAEQHRISQARQALSSLMHNERRAYLPVGDGTYARWSELLNKQAYRHKTLSHFFRDLETIKLRYSYLSELKDQFRTLDALLKVKAEMVGTE